MLRSSLKVTALSLIGSFLGLLVQLLMAQKYGIGVQVDTYLYAISTPTFVAGSLAALLSYTVVPQMAQQTDLPEQNRFIVSLLALALCISLIILLLTPALSYIQKQLLPENSPIRHENNLLLLLFIGWSIAAVQIVLAAHCTIITGLNRATVATALNLGPYLGMIIFMITMKASGTEQLAYGLLAGTTTSLFIGLFILSRRVFGHWRMAAWAQVRDLVVLSPFTMVATSCFSIYAVIDSYWATRAGDGVLASLGYSQRITIAIGNLAVVAPSAILVPKFSALVSKGIGDEFDKMLKKTLAITSAIGFTLAVGIYIGAVPLIELLFMRGAFDQNDVDRVAVILQFCLPGMSFSLLSVISLRILFCFPNIEKIAALLGILWCATYFFLSSMLYHLNGKGLAIAYSLTWTIYFFSVAYFLKIKQKKFTQ